MWWLTDVKRKEKTGDEDGPPDSESSAEEGSEAQKQPHELTSDSDPDSPRSDMDVPSQSQTVVLPVAESQRAPFVAWRDA